MPFNIGPPELLLVLVVVLILLGPGKLPEVGKALGRTVREFRKAQQTRGTLSVEPATRRRPAAAATPAAADTSPTTESDRPAAIRQASWRSFLLRGTLRAPSVPRTTKVMSLAEHLTELRRRLIISVIASHQRDRRLVRSRRA